MKKEKQLPRMSKKRNKVPLSVDLICVANTGSLHLGSGDVIMLPTSLGQGKGGGGGGGINKTNTVITRKGYVYTNVGRAALIF